MLVSIPAPTRLVALSLHGCCLVAVTDGGKAKDIFIASLPCQTCLDLSVTRRHAWCLNWQRLASN